MPIYEYRLAPPPRAPTPGSPPTNLGCETCRAGFQAMQKMSDPKITSCPDCDAPVERLIGAPSFKTSASEKQVLSSDNLGKNGFTRYDKAGGGEWVKTAGAGPDSIRK
jgi:putative FmdB family regulatory protein